MTRALALLVALTLGGCLPPAPPATAASAASTTPPSRTEDVITLARGAADVACVLAPTPDLCRAAVDAVVRLLRRPASSP